LFYNIHDTVTVTVSNVYLFCFFASFGVNLEGAGLGLGLGTAGLDYKTEIKLALNFLTHINHRVLYHKHKCLAHTEEHVDTVLIIYIAVVGIFAGGLFLSLDTWASVPCKV